MAEKGFTMSLKKYLCFFAWIGMATTLSTAVAQGPDLDFLNHNRPILDAHNCYPYEGQWNDRVTRALRSGFPVSIEQDLAWYVDPATGKGRVVVSHTPKPTGQEPTLREYFFEQVRPVIEKAIAQNKKKEWPLVVLHFDFKDNQPAILNAVWQLLGEYEPWLSTAVKTDDPHQLSSIERRPILAITEASDEQEKVFYDQVPVGAKLRIFGSAHDPVNPKGMPMQELMHWAVVTPPEQLLTERPTNYRRWVNSSWYPVEEGGQNHAGEWTQADDARLRALVDHAHQLGYWTRFYTLDGFKSGDDQGWGGYYNFGSKEAVILRWKAAIAAGVNFIATDQYEDLSPYLKQYEKDLRPVAPAASTPSH
ncbi:hypothetical protein AciX8_0963 [Granulicella mallensis MP5ACTX8]|uniref:Uncharacterized protein n=2 Tax=Granulicella mallensis TaxID=940614 RepID=G8NUF5_GRAMM|nr:hypothetical protein AciX8_0963 [Granulicella mallensis MP5ACTX8]